MQIQYSYRAIDKEFHEPWQRALGNVIEHALKPLLDKHTKDSVRLQIVLDRDKITAVPDIPLLPVFRGYEGIGFRKLFGAIA